jgi:hypothetical protein
MATDPKLNLISNVMPFPKFWKWLQGHANCILSAGTPETVLYDAEDFHWHLTEEDDGTLLVQLLRGKDMIGEIAIAPRSITYVQSEAKGQEEVVFECVAESDAERVGTYFFTLSHDYTVEEPKRGRFVH